MPTIAQNIDSPLRETPQSQTTNRMPHVQVDVEAAPLGARDDKHRTLMKEALKVSIISELKNVAHKSMSNPVATAALTTMAQDAKEVAIFENTPNEF